MITRWLCFLCLICGLVPLAGPCRAAAPADPIAAYFQSRSALPQPPLSAAPLVDAQQNPSGYLGKVFELTAQVNGLVTVGGERTVLLTVNANSLTAQLPATVAARTLDAGQTVRVLVQVERQGNEMSLSNLRLLALAPEYDVAAAERRMAAAAQARAASLPSRGTSPAAQRGQSERVAGVGAPAAGLSPRAQGIYGSYWNAVRRLNPRLTSAEVDKITYSVLFYSDQYDIDPRLVVAMVIAESDFDIHSTSRAGAMGLGQIMPEEASRLGVKDPYDPVQNLSAAIHILRDNLDKYGGAPWGAGIIPDKQIALTMAAYNAGPGAVHKYHGVPPYKETQRYVARVTALYKKMCGVKK